LVKKNYYEKRTLWPKINYNFDEMPFSSPILMKCLSVPLYNSQLKCLVPSQHFVKASLQLNSRLFLYKEDVAGFYIFEKYSIKAGPVITQNVGSWAFETGLKIPNPSIWERRANLRGTVLRDAVLDFSIFSQIQLDAKGQLHSISGISSDIMDQLMEGLNFSVTRQA
jgi:hypothetical protein